MRDYRDSSRADVLFDILSKHKQGKHANVDVFFK